MKNEAKWTVLLLALLFFGMCAACWLKPAKEASMTERRKLKQFPKVQAETFADGSFMTDFEDYALDQFPMRDGFRRLKAWVSQNIFRKLDNNDIYVAEGYAVKMEYPLNKESIAYAGERFEWIYENYLKEQAGSIYVSVIPDKNYFLGEKTGHLSLDYEKLNAMLQEEMPYGEFIDLTDTLSIEDYYQTDIHWRQEKLVDTAKVLGSKMGITLLETYEQKTLTEEFYGVYFGQSALDLSGETLSYLTNETLEQCTVEDYENGKTLGIYDFAKAAGKDPYEFYLSGPVSLLKITNPKCQTGKELVVFRDSFGSSLIPLLAEGYETLTLIDLRYISSRTLGNFVDFKGKDVLFLYSTSVLNHSETLK